MRGDTGTKGKNMEKGGKRVKKGEGRKINTRQEKGKKSNLLKCKTTAGKGG